ncbi:MAG TPA: beta-glucosidase [Verrucomicrobiae bacterium]|nr:beta-glucosidase [Verrucomicrobiae bacterium]
MTTISRRSFVRGSLAVGGAGWLSRLAAQEQVPDGWEVIGKLRPRSASAIAASPLGVGFETLDRQMFDPERVYPHLGRLGAKWARMQTGWGRCEQVKGQYDFAWLDAAVDRLLGLGIQPWFNLGYGNWLYTPEAPDSFAVGWIPLGTEGAQQGWLRFVRALGEHFRDRVKHWEIWNEPNHPNFWKPNEASPAEYVRFVRLTAPVIRHAVPGAVILGPTVWGPAYFRSCFDLGLGDLVDKVSYHWYRPTPEDKYEASIAECRAVLAEHKLKKALWQGESGCPSKPGSTGALGKYDWTEDLQARWVLRRTMSDLRLRIEMTSYFHSVDVLYPDRKDAGMVHLGGMNYKGLLRGEDYTPKPSYFAYQCLCALFDAQSEAADLSFDVSGPGADSTWNQTALMKGSFIRNGSPLHVYWLPLNLMKAMPRLTSNISVPAPSAVGIESPVLVDPLNATVHRPTRAERARGGWALPSAPLADYPLIIADRSAVELDV